MDGGGNSPMKKMHGGRASSSGGAVMVAVESGWCCSVCVAIRRYSRYDPAVRHASLSKLKASSFFIPTLQEASQGQNKISGKKIINKHVASSEK